MMMRRHAGYTTARYLLVGAMSAVLAGCGGSSGDGDGDGGFGDSNFDGIEDVDLDGDGIVDDVNGDGIEDFDLDGDGFLDVDLDGDGVIDGDEPAVPGDNDGDGFVDPTAENPCGSANGSDADSSDNNWNNNCTVSRFNQFSDSLYSAGIQRIVYCSVDSVAGSSVDAFTDGEFGQNTEEAVTAYQTLRNIGVDGAVGPETWGRMQQDLTVVEQAEFSGDGPFFDSYAVTGDRCAGTVLFYNEVSPAEDGFSVDALGWSLAKGATDPTPVEFSTAEPFGRID